MQIAGRISVLIVVMAGCGGSRDAGAAGEAARAPARAGQLWATAQASDRAAAPASLLAFVNGLHVMVLDGDEAFLGMTRLSAERGADGARALTLGDGTVARLIRAGDDLELRFSTGETIPMKKQEARK